VVMEEVAHRLREGFSREFRWPRLRAYFPETVIEVGHIDGRARPVADVQVVHEYQRVGTGSHLNGAHVGLRGFATFSPAQAEPGDPYVVLLDEEGRLGGNAVREKGDLRTLKRELAVTA